VTADVPNVVNSYAYVTSVEYDSEPAQSTASHRCNVIVLVPDATVTKRPADRDRALLAAGSRKIHRRVVDSLGHCKDFIHTWQPVWFAVDDRDNVHLDWPMGSDLSDDAVFVAMLGGLAWALAVYVRKKLASRRARRPSHS
jgi:hypothetical protein